MKILVTGGAGYIGSHTVVELLAAGHTPVIVDNFSNSNPKVLNRLKRLTGHEVVCHKVDVTDRKALEAVFDREKPEAVVHFAGYKAVGESVEDPLKYYRNNLLASITLLEVMQAKAVKRIVFSSTATVYGKNVPNPIVEDSVLNPQSPYAQTKLMIEQIIRDTAATSEGWSVALLRYFNPVGAHSSGIIGEDSGDAPNNLMPYVAKVAVGKQAFVRVFGNDYRTPDGTGRRDYLHVMDLAKAHVMAVDWMQRYQEVLVCNLGTGKPYSVLEVVAAFGRACGHELPYEIQGRRPGDIDEYWASPKKAETVLGWRAKHTLDEMCADMWRWQSKNPDGYNTAAE